MRNNARRRLFKQVSCYTDSMKIKFFTHYYTALISTTLFLTFLGTLGCQPKTDINTVIVALSDKPATLDPRISVSAAGMRITSLLFSSFVKVGPSLEVLPDASESWSFDKSTNSFTFIMKKNLKFSNGQPITAEDIEFSIKSFQNDNSPFAAAFKVIDEIAIKNKNGQMSVTLKLKSFSASFLSSDLPILKILPKKELSENPDNFFEKPVTSNSYVLIKEDTNSYLLGKNPHATTEAQTQRILFKVIKDPTTLYQKLSKGGVDLSQGELPDDMAAKLNPSEVNLSTYSGLHMTYLLLNMSSPHFKTLKSRQAIAHSLDLNKIIEHHLRSKSKRATSILTPDNKFFNNSLQPIVFNISQAQKLAKESGLLGKTLEFKVSTNPSSLSNAKVLASYLRKVGLTVNIKSLEWGTLVKDLKSGNYDISMLAWVGASDPDIYRVAFHSSEHPPGRNRGFYSNARVDRLVSEGRVEYDEKKRKHIYNKVQAQILKDLPIIPLWYEYKTAISSKILQGYKPYANGSFLPLLKVSKGNKTQRTH